MTQKIAAYDDDGIWGVGDTEEQARAEAEGYLREIFGPDDIDDEIAKLKTAPMSDGLLTAVLEASDGKTVQKEEVPFILDSNGVLIEDEDFAEVAEDAEDVEQF